jgi:hypothetical protein
MLLQHRKTSEQKIFSLALLLSWLELAMTRLHNFRQIPLKVLILVSLEAYTVDVLDTRHQTLAA